MKLGVTKFMQEPQWQKMIEQSRAYSGLAQLNLGTFPWEKVGDRLGHKKNATATIQKQSLGLGTDYARILKGLDESHDWLSGNPTLAKMPSIEYFTHSQALRTISTQDDSLEIIVSEPIIELQKETFFTLESYLPKLDAGLPKMWVGAVQALNSNNIDKIRHFNVSVRELFTHVLHLLAPDKAVRTWTIEPAYYHNNQPTRKARLLYICRHLTGGSFQKFLNRDIESMLELINLFQGGTHSIDSDFTEPQLFAIKTRVESALRFILEIEFQTNRI